MASCMLLLASHKIMMMSLYSMISGSFRSWIPESTHGYAFMRNAVSQRDITTWLSLSQEAGCLCTAVNVEAFWERLLDV
jgi:hypothetical protein